jgi:hypothetical protein
VSLELTDVPIAWCAVTENLDFTYVPDVTKPVYTTTLGRTSNVAQPIIDAAQHAYAIQKHPIAAWRDLLAAVPEELRSKCREILERRYKQLRERERRQQQGKRSAAGDAEVAKLTHLTQRM